MAVSSVYFAPGQTVRHHSGRSYTAAGSGLITVPAPDNRNVGGTSAVFTELYLTGTTADRLSLNPTATQQPPRMSQPFLDTTLAVMTFYVDGQSTTKWADVNGNMV